jgi:hypothetical protein
MEMVNGFSAGTTAAPRTRAPTGRNHRGFVVHRRNCLRTSKHPIATLASKAIVFHCGWFLVATRRALMAEKDRIRATPAFQRAEAYAVWSYGKGPCVAKSRRNLTLAAATLATGAAAMAAALAVRRRRVVERS